jgi:hypothetical protein
MKEPLSKMISTDHAVVETALKADIAQLRGGDYRLLPGALIYCGASARAW